MQRHCNTFFCIILSIVFIPAKGQSITPLTFNNGGGSNGTIEWSVGESASIGFFNSNNLILTTGVLQPLSNVVTSINDYNKSVFGNQILLAPNPVTSILNFKANFNQMGQLSIQIMDAKTKPIIVKQVGSVFNQYQTIFALNDLIAGMYYVKVDFKLMNGANQTAIFKIIKI